MEALDAIGNVIAIPDGVLIGFLGQQTGFDYRNVAVREGATTVAPEPATVVSMRAVLVANVLLRRRRAV